MSGTIGVICNDTRRFNHFLTSMVGMARHLPNDVRLLFADTSDRAKGRNEIVRSFLGSEGQWLMFIDDDHTFPVNHIPKLLSHNKPVVASLYLQRQYPYGPIAYSHRVEDKYYSIDLSQYPDGGLVEVFAAGTGGMLIRREVFEALDKEDHWFRNELSSEDLIFCEDVHNLGIPILLDLDARMGHLTVVDIQPVVNEDKLWGVNFKLSEQFNLEVGINNLTQ